MALNDSSYFVVRRSLTNGWIVSLVNIWGSDYHFVIICWIQDWRGFFIRWCTSSRGTSAMSLWSKPLRTISTNSIDFKLPKEEDIFIILAQNNFKHKLVKMLLLPFVILVINLKRSDYFNCVERNRRDGAGEVTYWMVMVFVISEGSRGELEPALNEIFFYTWFEFVHFSF